jgi:hypothetical protein
MSTATVTVTVDSTAALPAASAPFAKNTVTLTDSVGTVQTIDLVGTETPPWTAVFQNVAAVAGATGSVSVQALDSNGAAIGSPITAPFTEVGPPATFPAPVSVSVTIS